MFTHSTFGSKQPDSLKKVLVSFPLFHCKGIVIPYAALCYCTGLLTNLILKLAIDNFFALTSHSEVNTDCTV